MLVLLHLPGALRPYADGRSRVELTTAGATVERLLDSLGGSYPGVHHRVVDEVGSLRPHVNVFVNGENIRHLSGLATTLREGDEVWLLPAISGGSSPRAGPAVGRLSSGQSLAPSPPAQSPGAS